MTTNILKLRENSNTLQKTIAEVLKISQQQYSLYETERREMPISKYRILADYYNTSIDYLAGYTDEEKPYPKKTENKKD